jgi:protein required for attachment to host cells
MLEQLPHDSLVVVADGRKAILLRKEGSGSGQFPSARRAVCRLRTCSTTGPPARARRSKRRRRPTKRPSPSKLAEAPYKMHHRGLFSRLVLVADPQTLGQLLDTMHKSVRASIASTLDKELTNHSVPEITAALKS